jgi:phosphoglycerate dehydrogenase-like enzyme
MKNLLLTCPSMIKLPEVFREELKTMFRVTERDCLLSEADLLQIIPSIDVVVIGGEELYTLSVVKAAKPGVRFIFLGVQGDTSFTPEALRFIGGPEKILTTGGGLAEVARMTVAEIADPHVRKALLTGRTSNFRWVGAGELVEDMRPLSETEVSVIGAGNIGQQVLRALDGRCKKLIYHDPFGENPEVTSDTIIWEADLEKAFMADIVTLHLRLGPATEGLIGWQHLRHVRRWLINNSRAALVKAEDFAHYLERGGRAIWDVFYVEGTSFNRLHGDQESAWGRIAHSPNLFLTPHAAAFSSETFEEYGQGLLELIRKHALDK